MNNRTELEKQFKEECTVINLDAEYPGNPTHIKWAIITGYSREELESKYAEVLDEYRPYEISCPETKDAFAEYYRNEDKHQKRQQRGISIYDLDETVDARCPSVPFYLDELEKEEREKAISNYRKRRVRIALAKLTKTQRRRFIAHYLNKKTLDVIAQEENCTHQSIGESVEAAKNKFIKSVQNTLQNGTPLSKYSEEVISMSGLITSSTSND